jgi:hypothetical protein
MSTHSPLAAVPSRSGPIAKSPARTPFFEQRSSADLEIAAPGGGTPYLPDLLPGARTIAPRSGSSRSGLDAIFLRSLSCLGRESKRAHPLRPQRCGLGGCTRTRDLTLCVEDQRVQRRTSRIPRNICRNGCYDKCPNLPLCAHPTKSRPLLKRCRRLIDHTSLSHERPAESFWCAFGASFLGFAPIFDTGTVGHG